MEGNCVEGRELRGKVRKRTVYNRQKGNCVKWKGRELCVEGNCVEGKGSELCGIERKGIV